MQLSRMLSEIDEEFERGPRPRLDEEKPLFSAGDCAISDGRGFTITHIDVDGKGLPRLWHWSEYGYVFIHADQCKRAKIVPVEPE